ncbi:MAG: saccharopine dehydrogenase C-terminal domain-containing protein [Saprospiraceae bacterium]|nr:saccharopine dehydrogenase C-terminal domain-containing protein [Saprospiraceae bacterium]
MTTKTIFIAGAGGIGQAAALILCEYNSIMDVTIYLGDINENALHNSRTFVIHGCSHEAEVHTVLMPKSGSSAELDDVLTKCDVILDCLPGSQAPRMAKLALDNRCHYANLTEYVQETNDIMELSKGADTAFVLQTGLAPGFINVLACQLYNKFKAEYDNDTLDQMTMKVGAVTPHALAPHYYAFTWSPIGVATEYLKDAVVVKDYKTLNIPALSGRETLYINGKEYEDNFTSGGAADLPSAFEGKIKDLDYKTLRLPGHYEWVDSILKEIPEGNDRIDTLEKTMLDQVPSVEDDIVVVYASVTGKDSNGRLRKIEKAYEVAPSKVGNKYLRAIQSTTAAPLCEMARMMIEKNWKGTILQSQIDPESFMNGPYVSAIYKD